MYAGSMGKWVNYQGIMALKRGLIENKKTVNPVYHRRIEADYRALMIGIINKETITLVLANYHAHLANR